MNKIALSLPFILLGAPASFATGAESLDITYREQITNFWGGREVKLHLDVAAKEAFSGTLHWSLNTAGRTLISRDAELEIAAGKASEVEIRYTLPGVKDSVVYPIELRASAAAKDAEPEAELRETFHLFGPNPFAERTEWLKSLKIHVFDPEDATAKALEDLEVPFERITNLATLPDLTEGIVIVGENVAWDDYGELGELLLNASARGLSVLCLAPATAEFALPVTKRDDIPAADQISFRRSDVLRDLDKRFSLAWSQEHATVRRGWAVVAEKEAVLTRAAEPVEGWPWIEMRFPKREGKTGTLVACGFGVIRSWEESPTPRYLLARWLERLSPPTPP